MGYFNPVEKPTRWQDKKYLAWLRKQRCVFCNKLGPNEAHHLRQFCFTGTGTKPSDSYAVPACCDCHENDQMHPCKEAWLITECVKLLTKWMVHNEAQRHG